MLKWVFDRVNGASNAVRTPIGYLPSPADIDTNGLDVDSGDMDTILSVDVTGWREALPQIRDHYAQFGAKLPARLADALDNLDQELANA